MVFQISKAKTSPARCGFNTFPYDGPNLWKKFYHVLLFKEPNLTITKLKKILQIHLIIIIIIIIIVIIIIIINLFRLHKFTMVLMPRRKKNKYNIVINYI